MKDDTLQRNTTGFTSGTVAPNYKEMPIFSALIKHVEKKIQSVRFHAPKTYSLHLWNQLGIIKRFVTCKPPGYAFERLPEVK